MQDIEPFYNWRHIYTAADDPASPFYGREYSEFEYSSTVYNYYIHPQWDDFGSETLYLKIICVDYTEQFAVIEFIGEWNDAIGNDIMFLKRDVMDELLNEGIRYFILIGENVLNFHASDTDYYEEWFDDTDTGWLVGLNFREHVVRECQQFGLDQYILFSGRFNGLAWRKYQPVDLFNLINSAMQGRLNA
jgi:hypothetical protein